MIYEIIASSWLSGSAMMAVLRGKEIGKEALTQMPNNQYVLELLGCLLWPWTMLITLGSLLPSNDK